MNREQRRNKEFGRGAYAFFADNTAHVGLGVFNARFNEAMLLHGSVGVADVWTVNSKNVRRRLETDDGAELLRQGLVFALRRDSAPSFEGMFDGLIANGAHAISEEQRPYVRRLDATAANTAVTWSFGDVRKAYIEASDTLFTGEVLSGIELSDQGAALIVNAYEAAKAAYHGCSDADLAKTLDPYTNTWVFDRVSENGKLRLEGLSQDDGDRAWRAARTMYMFNIPTLKELAIAAQDDFDGTTTLKVLRRHMQRSADLTITPATISEEDAFRAALANPAIAWLFSFEVVGTLTAEELTAATRVEYASEYHAARTAFLADPNESTWLVLVDRMRAYLDNAANEVIRLRTRQGSIQDPGSSSVVLTGDVGSLQMQSGAEGVHMAGLPASFRADPVQVVARHIDIPRRVPPIGSSQT